MLLTHLTPDGVRHARHRSLTLYGLPDAAGSEGTSASLAEIARLARGLTGAERAFVSLLPEGRQVTVAATAADHPDEMPEGDSICAVLLEQRPVGTIVVPDLARDHRFTHNPYVDGRRASTRGYAAAPLVGHERVALGTICVAWPVPRTLTRDEASLLHQFARAAVNVLDEARRDLRVLTRFPERPAARRSSAA